MALVPLMRGQTGTVPVEYALIAALLGIAIAGAATGAGVSLSALLVPVETAVAESDDR